MQLPGLESRQPIHTAILSNMADMKAIVVREFGGPEVLTLAEVPDPVPGTGQVLVRVHAAGVNPFDTYMRTGTYATAPLPYAVALVSSTPSVRGFGAHRRARVFFSGTATHKAYGAYAQKVLCEPQQVHPLPDRLSFAQGAGVGVPYVTAWRALHDRARLQPGETLLIHGASGVGGRRRRCARVGRDLAASTKEGLDVVKQQGAHHVLNHKNPATWMR